MSYRGYLITLALTVIALVGGIVLLNAIADPLDIYRWVKKPGFNAYKVEYQPYARIAKPIQIERHGYRRLAFGSSRVDLGIPVEVPPWAGSSPEDGFNAGLNASSLQTILDVLQHAAAVSPVNDVLIGVDFYMFNGLNQGRYAYPDILASYTPRDPQRYFWQASLSLFSPSITSASVRTLRKQGPDDHRRKPTGQAFTPREIAKVRETGYEAQFRKYEDGLVRRVWTPCRDNRYRYSYRPAVDTLALFDELLHTAEAHDIRLTLFIAPMHARLLETLDAANLWPEFEQWKRDLSRKVAAHNRDRTGPPVRLWDFSGYHAYAVEPLPADGGVMRWYIDSSHYTEALGQRMLAILYGDAPPDFGMPLTPDTVTPALQRIRDAQRRYRLAHAGQWAQIQQRVHRLLAQKRQNGRPCPNTGLE